MDGRGLPSSQASFLLHPRTQESHTTYSGHLGAAWLLHQLAVPLELQGFAISTSCPLPHPREPTPALSPRPSPPSPQRANVVSFQGTSADGVVVAGGVAQHSISTWQGPSLCQAHPGTPACEEGSGGGAGRVHRREDHPGRDPEAGGPGGQGVSVVPHCVWGPVTGSQTSL